MADGRGGYQCSTCSKVLPLEAFRTSGSKADGTPKRRSNCKDCGREAERERYARCGNRKTPEKQRGYSIKHKYGISLDEWNAILDRQGGVCAVCERVAKRWATDHDHSCCPGERTCGECVRSILCSQCNTALGLLGESVERALALVAYMEASHVR